MSDEKQTENIPVGIEAVKAVKAAAVSPNLIQQVYLCTVVDAEGRERVLSTVTARGMTPMMAVDETERGALETAAQEISNVSGARVRIIRLSQSEVIQIIERQLVTLDTRGISGGGSAVEAAKAGGLGKVIGKIGGSGVKIGS